MDEEYDVRLVCAHGAQPGAHPLPPLTATTPASHADRSLAQASSLPQVIVLGTGLTECILCKFPLSPKAERPALQDRSVPEPRWRAPPAHASPPHPSPLSSWPSLGRGQEGPPHRQEPVLRRRVGQPQPHVRPVSRLAWPLSLSSLLPRSSHLLAGRLAIGGKRSVDEDLIRGCGGRGLRPAGRRA